MGDDNRLKPSKFLMQMMNDDEALLERNAQELGVSKADVMRMGLRMFDKSRRTPTPPPPKTPKR